MSWRLSLVSLTLALAAVAIAPRFEDSAFETPAMDPAELLYSADAALTTIVGLSDAHVSGIVHIHVRGIHGITDAQFFLDDPKGPGRPGVPFARGTLTPADGGASYTVDTTTLADGMHSVGVVTTDDTGGVAFSFARFAVTNAMAGQTSPSPPAPSPPTSSPPASYASPTSS